MINLNRFYLILIFLLFSSLIWFDWNAFRSSSNNNAKTSNTINLGLELVGGSALTLQADFAGYLKEISQANLNDLKKTLSQHNLTYQQVIVRSIEKKFEIVFILNDKNFKNFKEDVNLNSQLSNNYKIKINEAKNELAFALENNYLNFLQQSALKEAIKNIQNRIDALGNKEITIETLGEDKILLQAPGFSDTAKLRYMVGKTSKLTFHLVDDQKKNNDLLYLNDEKNNEYSLVKTPILDGTLLKNAFANINNNGQTTVNFSLNKKGTEIFAEVSAANIGKRIAIVIDEQVISAPVIREAITGGGVEISGGFDFEEARNLATSLRSGALPIKLNITEEKLVGAAAGDQLIAKGKMALIIALIAVGLFMIFVYGLLGLVAVFSIMLNLLLIIAILVFTESTLSLAGIAGLVLTVGIVVDNNVLIFERMREELKINPRAYVRAIQVGFERALVTIIDSNVTTIIAAGLLLWFGDNNIKGFALTLIYGVVISFFSTILVAQIIIKNFQNRILFNSFWGYNLKKKLLKFS